MGRSAKMHKRTSKKATSLSVASSASAQSASKPIATVPTPLEQKKRAGLKAKAGQRRKDDTEGPILGGADYVELMLGSRRRAMEEAVKLPQDP
ncbi:hypothetical protein B0H21DRAFT_698208 [Amylocystis lapponica]|nr:hypothetical protein B0H21DRAFT_698208 [Amylocystis lapponica]